jgi:hypothetical protein
VSNLGASVLAELEGETLTMVMFEHDFLRLAFSYGLVGPMFTLNVWPIVSVRSMEVHYGERGYRDCLCNPIGRTITATEESEARGLVLEFDESSLQVQPRSEEVRGPEIATLEMREGNRSEPVPRSESVFMVWVPGEGVFESIG